MKVTDLIKELLDIERNHGGDKEIVIHHPLTYSWYKVTDVLWNDYEDEPMIEVQEDE